MSPKNVPLTVFAPKSDAPIRKQVRFGQIDLQVQNVTPSRTSATTVVQRRNTPVSTAEPGHIHSLCEAVQQAKNDPYIGYLLDAANRNYGVFSLKLPSTASWAQWRAYTLQEVLTRQANVPTRLTQYDKLRVAVDVASSVLQLYKTPWFDPSWGRRDVYFVQRPEASPSRIYEQSFVLRQMSDASQISPTSNQQATSRVVRNQTLWMLGVLLIELWYGKTIEDLKTASDKNWHGTPSIAWCTAERIVENEIEFEAGQLYSDAVRRCIRCDFDRKENDLENEAFQQAVFHGVVVPLETTLQQFSGHGANPY